MTSPRSAAETRIAAAMKFAFCAHDGQRRKDGRTPYIVHPIAVVRYLSSDLRVSDPDLLSAAALHDVIEDTGTSLGELARHFGRNTARLVEELTVPREFHGPEVPDSRKTEVLVRDIARMSWKAVLIKLADRLDNLSDMNNAVWSSQKRRRYIEQTAQLLDVVKRRQQELPPPNALTRAVARVLRDLEEERRSNFESGGVRR